MYSYSAEEKFQPEEIDTFKEIFSYFDKKGDGLLNTDSWYSSDLGLALRAAGMVATSHDIAALKKKHSGAKDGEFIDFESFLNCIAELSITEATPDSIKSAFYLFDKNDNGLIQISEFKHVLSSIGDVLTEEEMDAIISALDVNGDSFLRMADVISLLHIAPPHINS